MSKEAMKLALEALEETRNALAWFYDSYPQDVTKKGNELLPYVETVLTALREALAKPDFWEGYVPEPEQPAQQCKWPTCQSEEYQQALAEQIKRELVGEQPAHQEPVWDASAPLVMTPHPAFQQPAQRKPLADEEIKKLAAPLFMTHYWKLCNEFARAIENAHGIKENT